MKRTVGIGYQYFEDLRSKDLFYVDKTHFIKEWWERKDDVTLITRPRRFGKTLNMSMMDCFFSNEHEDRGGLFEGLSIWEDEEYRKLQGTYPVIFLSFAGIKGNTFAETMRQINKLIVELFARFSYLMETDSFVENERKAFANIEEGMDKVDAEFSLSLLSSLLEKHYGKKVLLFLDEYDTPMQEAYINGYWKELTSFIRTMFNNTFKTNPHLERAILTGITRVSKESVFSDLNNLNVVTTTSDEYADCFGFTEEEVFAAMDEYGYQNKEEVKQWYDGFTFGDKEDIYNPWSITNFLAKGKLDAYWANTSGNGLVSHLIQSGNVQLKDQVEDLMHGKTVRTRMDEQIVFSRLDGNEEAVWGLLVAAGYLKVLSYEGLGMRRSYELALTNFEVHQMFEEMIREWFLHPDANYNGFVNALLKGDLEAMNCYMNDIAMTTASSFDTGKSPSKREEPERFYHGFVLGLLVELKDRYELRSNRESGFGRYDVMLLPRKPEDDGIIMEFKVFQPKKEESLEDTVMTALWQIEDRDYAKELLDRGIERSHIRSYGFAFRGKEVLIG